MASTWDESDDAASSKINPDHVSNPNNAILIKKKKKKGTVLE